MDIKKSMTGSPRSFADYQVTAHEDRLPMGVQLLKLAENGGSRNGDSNHDPY
ncbi:MAG: hypothetical protein ACREPG_10890 [Candidatus Binatia bacterium]